MTSPSDDVEKIREEVRAKNLATLIPKELRADRKALPLDDGEELDGASGVFEKDRGGFMSGVFDAIDDNLPGNVPDFVNGKTVVFGLAGITILLLIVGLVLALSGGEPATTFLPIGTAVVPNNVPEPTATTTGVFGFDVQGPPPINVNASVTLATVWVMLLIVFGFAETVSRKERFALDFWAPIFFVTVAVFRGQLSRDTWLILQSISGTAVLAAVAINENRPAVLSGKSVWAQIFNLVTGVIDMTPMCQVGALLLALGYARWAVLPYPMWIDLKIAWSLLIIGVLFEVSRAPIITLIAIALGGIAGFLFDPWLTMATALIVVVMGAIFSQVGWLPTTSHQGQAPVEAMGRNLTVVLRWDLVLLATTAYFLMALSAHGNVVIYHLSRIPGG